jgi:hypothetical protein
MPQVIPQDLMRSKYWKPVLFLFSEHSKLSQYFTTKYFDLSAQRIKVQALKNVAKPWSESEKFMLNLALHCYNERNRVNLGDMDYLDANNTELAFKALRMRYGS